MHARLVRAGMQGRTGQNTSDNAYISPFFLSLARFLYLSLSLSLSLSFSLSFFLSLSLSLAVARCRLASFTYYSSLSLPAADWRCFGVFGVERFKPPHTNWLFAPAICAP